MPVSKKRKKDGKKVGNGQTRRVEQLENMESGVTLQDLINAVAYQEYVKEGKIEESKVIEDAEMLAVSLDLEPNAYGESIQIDFNDPVAQKAIKAVHNSTTNNKEQD